MNVPVVDHVRRHLPPDYRLVLLALVGSHAYGTSHPESDMDYRGMFMAPSAAFFRLDGHREAVNLNDPDVQAHELRKFCLLAAAANPTVLETLWCDALYLDDEGERLQNIRHAFLSKRVFQTYGGYATQQIRKAHAGSGGSRGVKHLRREKFLLHTLRLMEAGIYCLKYGEVMVQVPDPDRLWATAREGLEAVEHRFLELNSELQAAYDATDLPDQPDFATINWELESIRRRNL